MSRLATHAMSTPMSLVLGAAGRNFEGGLRSHRSGGFPFSREGLGVGPAARLARVEGSNPSA